MVVTEMLVMVSTIHKHKHIMNLEAVKHNAAIKQCQIHLFPVYNVNVQEAKWKSPTGYSVNYLFII